MITLHVRIILFNNWRLYKINCGPLRIIILVDQGITTYLTDDILETVFI